MTHSEEKRFLAAVRAFTGSQTREASVITDLQQDLTEVITTLEQETASDPMIEAAIVKLQEIAAQLGKTASGLKISSTSLAQFLAGT